MENPESIGEISNQECDENFTKEMSNNSSDCELYESWTLLGEPARKTIEISPQQPPEKEITIPSESQETEKVNVPDDDEHVLDNG